jgi:hypothetical protein
MFNSRPLSGSVSHVWAYLTGSEKGAEEYYLGQGEATAEVFGKGAERLGIDAMDKETFANLAKGLSPDGTQRLIQTQNGKHTIGIDACASADKSVSVAMIGATPAQRDMIQACWDEAFDASLDYIQDHARLCRVPVRSPALAGERLVTKGTRARFPGPRGRPPSGCPASWSAWWCATRRLGRAMSRSSGARRRMCTCTATGSC